MLCVPRAGARGRGSRPCRGSVVRSPRGSGLRRESPLQHALWCGRNAPPVWRKPLLSLNVSPSGQGKGVLLGAAAPRSTPFQPPPTTPLGFPGGHCSHGSVGFWEKPTRTTLARKGRYRGMTFWPRPARRRAVLSRAVSGDEPWANGVLSGGRSRHWGQYLRGASLY